MAIIIIVDIMIMKETITDYQSIKLKKYIINY